MGAEGSKPSPTVVAEQEGGNANAATHSAANSTTDEGISSTTPAKIEEHKDEKEDPSQPLVYYFYATLQMYIPIEDVGIVVGKQRQTLTQLQEDMKTHIIVPKNRDPDTEGGSYWAPISIRGECRSLWDCYQRISVLVDDVDDVVVHFPVKKNRHSLLLGKGAKTLKRVGADSGARIYIPPENELENSTITLEGDIEQVASAFEMFANELLKVAMRKSTVFVSSKDGAIGNVVGKGRSRLEEIQKETGTRISMRPGKRHNKDNSQKDQTKSDHQNRDAYTKFTISGGADHVYFARLIIESLLTGSKLHPAIRDARSKMREEALPVIISEKEAYWLAPAYRTQQELWLAAHQQKRQERQS